MSRPRYRFIDVTEPHYMTCTVLNWVPVFTSTETVQILLDSLRFLSRDGLKVHAYVILENHLHLVAQSADLSRDMCRFKSHTAKQLLAHLKTNGFNDILDQLAFHKNKPKPDREHQFWKEGLHPEWLQNDEMMRAKIDFIHNHPVERGYVDEPEHWRYSSARNYAGLGGLIDVRQEWYVRTHAREGVLGTR